MVYLVKGVLTVVLCYGFVVLAVYALQRKLIYFPSKSAPVLGNLSSVYTQVYTQTSDGIQLLHWYARKGDPVIVVFHGNAGNIEDRGSKFKFLADQGYSVLLAGYRGYGSNSGSPAEQDFIADSALLIDWLLKKEGLSAQDIVFFGESLGSGSAIALAVQYKVKSLIFEGAPSSVLDMAQEAYPFLPVRWMLKDSWDSNSRIKNIKDTPKLFIHAKQDSVVPFRWGQKLFNSALEPKRYLWLDRAGHVDNLDLVQKEVLSFLKEPAL